MKELEIRFNTASPEAIASHLQDCDDRFIPRLSARVDLRSYAQKLSSFSERIEAWSARGLEGLMAVYLNQAEGSLGFISSMSVNDKFSGRGLGSELMNAGCSLARKKGFRGLQLEVSQADLPAQAFYRKHGFRLSGQGRAGFLMMMLPLSDL